jgi:glutamine amidotransferase
MSRIAIIDYGMGNLHSVASALQHVCAEADVVVTADALQIEQAARVIFPGVGAMRDCMSEIRRLNLDAVVKRVIEKKTPLLAICVGLQALLERSEENNGVECLKIFPGQVRFFGNDVRDQKHERLKVPHMGWNEVQQTRAHPLWQGISDQTRLCTAIMWTRPIIHWLRAKPLMGKHFLLFWQKIIFLPHNFIRKKALKRAYNYLKIF